MTDIVERLRAACQKGREDIEPWQCDPFLFDEAAAEIERLRAEADKAWTKHLIEREELKAEIERLREEGTVELAKALLEIAKWREECERLGNERDALRNALQVMVGEKGEGLSYSERCAIVAKALKWVSAP